MITEYTGWRRDKPGLGVWSGKGKTAFAGIGHSDVDRRWDGKDMKTTLGMKAIQACERALADAGVKPEDVDGLLCCPDNGDGSGGPAGRWAPRPYFAPPYDSEAGLSIVTSEWLLKNMPRLKNVQFAPTKAPWLAEMVGMAPQAIVDGKCHTCLVVYTMGNLEGRYRQGGEGTVNDTVKGSAVWSSPWGNSGGNMFVNIFPQIEYDLKYGGQHDDLAPFVINQHRNGRMAPWGYYTNHEPQMLTHEDYVTSRFILRPLRIWDCDRPVNAVTAYLITTAERARSMRQKPVYIWNHNQGGHRSRSTHVRLAEVEQVSRAHAKNTLDGAGITAKDIDIFNPYDGYANMPQFFLEGFQYKGVGHGDAYHFYKSIAVEGPTPFSSGGGNLGNGRTRTALFTDTIEQLRGTTGVMEGFTDPVKHLPLKNKRKVTTRAEIGVCGLCGTGGGDFVVLSSQPG